MRFSGVSLVCALLGIALVGCGQKTDSSNVAPSTTQQPEAKKTTDAAGPGLTADQEKSNAAFPQSALKDLPEAVIVRVPVDANGKELSNMSEVRLHAGAAASQSDAVAVAFSKGSVPTLAKSELDKDSSTQSWWWNRGCNNWYSYRPYYNYYGYSYYYTQPVYYGCGNYNYYYYRNYNSCGYGRGYGYGYGY